MNGHLAAISELVEHATDVRSDLGISDAYSLRLGLILQDAAFAESLASAHLDVDDLALMSASSWVWYLRWRCVRASAPPVPFLMALYGSTPDGTIRRSIVDSVLNAQRPTLSEVRQPGTRFLRNFLELPDQGGASPATQETALLEIADYLLDIGTRQSLTVFASLLDEYPTEHDRLIGLVYSHISSIEPHDDARTEWLEAVGLTQTPPEKVRRPESGTYQL